MLMGQMVARLPVVMDSPGSLMKFIGVKCKDNPVSKSVGYFSKQDPVGEVAQEMANCGREYVLAITL